MKNLKISSYFIIQNMHMFYSFLNIANTALINAITVFHHLNVMIFDISRHPYLVHYIEMKVKQFVLIFYFISKKFFLGF